MINHNIQKIQNILEALPYITKFSGKTIVIKYGGAAMVNLELQESFARDIVLLKYLGMKVVIVHGGGPEINQLLKTLDIKSEFVRGHRKTDAKTMEVVEMVLSGKVNKQIVSLIHSKGGSAVGISARDGKLAIGEVQKMEITNETGEKVLVDVGQVGNITKVNPSILNTLIHTDFIPVVSPVAETENQIALNINADTMAGHIAGALKAEKLVLLTDTPGVLIHNELVSKINKDTILQHIQSGQISGGMIPKVECCLEALSKGIQSAHIIDGRIPHSVLIEIFTDTGIGTLIES